ncbi:hypothetical protein D3C77_632140 [compost metagenome]
MITLLQQWLHLLDQRGALGRVDPVLQLVSSGKAHHRGEHGPACVRADHIDAQVSGPTLRSLDGTAQPGLVLQQRLAAYFVLNYQRHHAVQVDSFGAHVHTVGSSVDSATIVATRRPGIGRMCCTGKCWQIPALTTFNQL